MIRNNKDNPKTRRFRIWSVCIVIVVVTVSIVFVARVAGRASEPFVSASFGRINIAGSPAISIELSNRMPFNLNYMIVSELPHRGSRIPVMGNNFNSLTAHKQKRQLCSVASEGEKFFVVYARELKPIEKSVFKTFPWLGRHYPFRSSFNISQSVSNVQASSQFKEQ